LTLASNMSGFFGLSALVAASLSYKWILKVRHLSVVTSQYVRCWVLRMRSGNALVVSLCISHKFTFRWRHHVHSTVVRPFCKIGTLWKWYILETMTQLPHWLRGQFYILVFLMQKCFGRGESWRSMTREQAWVISYDFDRMSGNNLPAAENWPGGSGTGYVWSTFPSSVLMLRRQTELS